MAFTKRQVISNFIWRYLERCSAQLVSFIVSIILARILGPEAYGTLALITVFINIFQVFATGGLGSAIVQKKEPDDLDFSTVFWSQMFLCTFIYIILFCGAPLIAKLYKRTELIGMMRVLGISILIFGLRNIQLSYISKKMLFKKFFFATLSGTISAAVVGIVLAIKGFGTWALIAQHLINLFIDSVILWLTSGWKPKFLFALNRLRNLIGFGIRSLISSLIDTLFNNLNKLVVSKVYSTTDLAYYTKGQVFPNFIEINILTSLSSVLYPAYTESQDDLNKLKGMMRRTLKMETFILSPLLLGLAACSDSVVRLLLTEKWVQSVLYLQIFCVVSLCTPMVMVTISAINAIGKNGVTLVLNIIKRSIGVLVLLVTVWISVKAIAFGVLFSTVIFQIINAAFNKKIIHYSFREQILDTIPNILLAVVMAILVYLINFLNIQVGMKICLQIFTGIIIYITLAWLLKNESFDYSIQLIKKGMASSESRKASSDH